MNDREEIIKAGLGVVIILLMIVFLFAIWGGKPRGVYWKVEDLKMELQELEHRIETHRHTGIYGLPK